MEKYPKWAKLHGPGSVRLEAMLSSASTAPDLTDHTKI